MSGNMFVTASSFILCDISLRRSRTNGVASRQGRSWPLQLVNSSDTAAATYAQSVRETSAAQARLRTAVFILPGPLASMTCSAGAPSDGPVGGRSPLDRSRARRARELAR